MLDTALYRDFFSSAAMRDVWSQQTMLKCWLEVEQGLAHCQAQCDLVPRAVAAQLAELSVEDLDVAALEQKMHLVGRPIVGLVEQLRARLPEELARYVHFLSTTQDVMDTGCALQMQQALNLIYADLDTLLAQLRAHSHRQTECEFIARTNGQHAVAMRFSTKLEVWIGELERRLYCLQGAAQKGLLVQLGGPVGDLSQYPAGSGQAVKVALAERLGLGVVEPHWQNARDAQADIVTALGALAASLCKIAHNIALLASSDIAELSEGYEPGRGASSSMAHKRNQRACEFAEATARLARQRAEQIGELTLQQHERSGGAMIAEWLVIPEVFTLCSGALMWSVRLFEHLEVKPQRMAQNLALHRASLER
ncbi:MAG: lyase family protein [Pseudomonadales bacterium]